MEKSIFINDYNFENDLRILRLYINDKDYNICKISDEYIENLNNLINQYHFLDYNICNNNKNDNKNFKK